jgi:hypothetical protein
MAPWRVISNDGKIKLTFYPKSFVPVDLDILVYFAKLKKFYGTFSGQIMLEDGEVIQVNNLLGFTENLLFKW